MKPILKMLIILISVFLMIIYPLQSIFAMIPGIIGFMGIWLIVFSISGFLQEKRENDKEIPIF